jgi:GH18 family chitinase
LTPSFEVEVGDVLSTYQFNEFKRIKGVKRILSFGGWDFLNNPQTYTIFRNGVMPANRLTVVTNIANFVKKHDLDGVDIDWEYPGAPDLPESDPGKPEEGTNYLFFLVTLKNLLRGRTVSIAAPSSYWYLKQYPIEAMGAILDYIVFMTYDLHGQVSFKSTHYNSLYYDLLFLAVPGRQWDANNQWSQEGCPTGNCLRT